jgi:hypothetical protein
MVQCWVWTWLDTVRHENIVIKIIHDSWLLILPSTHQASGGPTCGKAGVMRRSREVTEAPLMATVPRVETRAVRYMLGKTPVEE